MMAEYIEREKAIRDLVEKEQYLVGSKLVRVGALVNFLRRRPAADVVPVIRCKSCAYRYTIYCGLDNAMFVPSDDSFCSYGVKKYKGEDDDCAVVQQGGADDEAD